MSGETALINPEYVRLSGEVADQTVLDSLRAAFPNARVAHAFASTEAGVAFDVNDGLAGFPAEFVGNANAPIQMKVQDGTLWIRSGRTAARYLGSAAAALSAETASSIRVTCWNSWPAATIFGAARAASSTSAD